MASNNHRQEAFIRHMRPNPDGDDYADGGKFYNYRWVLRQIQQSPIPDDVKFQAIDFLEAEVFPFLERREAVHESEAKEYMAVVRKYHGPDGIRKPFTQESDEIEARVTTILGLDAELLDQVTRLFLSPSDFRSGNLDFDYGNGGTIMCRFMEREIAIEGSGSRGLESPSINPIPFGAEGSTHHHHNINPDDDLSLNHSLLRLLQDLMKLKSAQSFIDFDHENREYYITRPRCLSFIERGLKLDTSIGYGATAFFNDMLLVFTNTRNNPTPDLITTETKNADALESEMMKRLRTMGSAGERLLAQYKAIKEQGPENWDDPEIIYFQRPYNPHLPGFNGMRPNEFEVKARAWDQLKRGLERVQRLRVILASSAPNTAGSIHSPVVHGGAPPSPKPAKRTREESVEDDEDGSARAAKRQRSDDSARPGPSRPSTAAPRQAASKRSREPEDIDGNDSNEDSDHSHAAAETRASKRQRLTKAVATSSLPATSLPAASLPAASLPAAGLAATSLPTTSLPSTSFRATRSRTSDPGSSTAPPQASSSKRARMPADADNDGDDDDDGDSQGPSGSKRRRLVNGASSSSFLRESPEAGPSTAGRAAHEPAGHVSDSGQAQASSAASQPAPQQPQQPIDYPMPSSQSLSCSSKLISMRYISKMGKNRPWLFGYDTPNGYGIYAFMKCPRDYCKCRFQIHPLKNDRAREHIRSCGQGQVFQDEQEMVLQCASQVIKDAGRVSDLTIEWARKSNMTLLPANERDNHPDNFPTFSPPADE